MQVQRPAHRDGWHGIEHGDAGSESDVGLCREIGRGARDANSFLIPMEGMLEKDSITILLGQAKSDMNATHGDAPRGRCNSLAAVA